MAGTPKMVQRLRGRRRLEELERENAELRQRAQTSRRSEDLYRRAIVQAGAVPYALDYATYRYSFIGDGIEELTGYSSAEFTPDLWEKLAEEAVLLGEQAGLSNDEAVRRTRSGEFPRWRCDHRIKTRHGEHRWISDASVEVIGEDGRSVGSIGMLQDVTERYELQAQLRQAQKMEAIGRLAGGIAHDFNNLLTVIGGYSMLALGRLEAGSPLRQEVEEISKAGELAAALTQQLLIFSRRQVLQPQIVDLNRFVADFEALLRRLIREDIVLETRLAEGPIAVSADAGQLSQVIVNLVVNAEDAMPDGGRLSIQTAAVDLHDSRLRGDVVLEAGPYALLSVTDTGTGMDEETLAQIFEPFFTTKHREKGTGLGLATVFGIVEQSGGHVAVESGLGEGSTFTVYLPRVDGVPVEGRTAETGPERAAGQGSVLLVEDDEAVRRLARDVLLLHGYTVVEAAAGDEALEVASGWTGPLDLLVTDLVMPGLSGRELAERLGERWPDLRVLFMSGYADDAFFRFGSLSPGQAFMQKPFTPGVLARKARDVLASSG